MKKNAVISSILLMVFAFYPNALRSQPMLESGFAKVKAETLFVHSENSPSSKPVKVLKKGDVVWVQMQIIGSEGKWCLISEGTQKTSLGFVSCKDLGALNSNSNIAGQTFDPQGNIPSSIYLGSLLQAVWKGDVLTVKELIEKGGDPNAQTKLGKSPLHVAATKEETEITSVLIASGADVNAKDQIGKTPLMVAVSAGRRANAEVLLSAGAKVNALDESGFTALMWAAMLGFPEFVEILLETGADVNARSKDGRTALGISQNLAENTTKLLARAFKANKDVSELQIKLANHKNIFHMLKEAGGRQ
jgi:ankyrin repeat protein